jgi:hypothetical protein
MVDAAPGGAAAGNYFRARFDRPGVVALRARRLNLLKNPVDSANMLNQCS